MAWFLLALSLLTAEPAVSLKAFHGWFAPTDVRMIVRIVPHPDNRLLRLELNGPFSTASTFQLDGENAPRILERWFKSVRAPGWYRVTALVLRVQDKVERAYYDFCLRGGDELCESTSSSPTPGPASPLSRY